MDLIIQSFGHFWPHGIILNILEKVFHKFFDLFFDLKSEIALKNS